MTTRKKLTVYDIQQAKIKGQQLTEIFTVKPDEAKACEDAGIDIILTMTRYAKEMREAAPNTFLVLADNINDPDIVSEEQAISSGFKALNDGADAYYTHLSHKLVAAMSREHIPVVGHVGYIPYRGTWYGKARAVGKKHEEAVWVYEETMAYQDAGAFAVEMEIVPYLIADEIAKRVEIVIMSMGSGVGGDVQYLFATDVLGTNAGHVPRHAKIYGELLEAERKVQELRVKALAEFKKEVTEGVYPADNHLIPVNDKEYQAFLKSLKGNSK
jgi:3-methyl-2-oxobutanoate hydroxymethyltransferase